MSLKEIIAAYEALIAKCMVIVVGAPFWQWDAKFARISIEGAEIVFSWPDAECGCSFNFPASLLLLSDNELLAWKKEQLAIHNLKQEKSRAILAKSVEEEERALLAVLKNKYE